MNITTICNDRKAMAHAGHLGLPIPEKLKAILAQLHDKLPDADSTTDPGDGE